MEKDSKPFQGDISYLSKTTEQYCVIFCLQYFANHDLGVKTFPITR